MPEFLIADSSAQACLGIKWSLPELSMKNIFRTSDRFQSSVSSSIENNLIVVFLRDFIIILSQLKSGKQSSLLQYWLLTKGISRKLK